MDLTAIRAASKALLGNQYRLEICAALTERQAEAVSATEMADLLEIKYARAHEELKRLLAAGLLREPGAPVGGRTVDYKVVPSVYWEMCAALLAEIKGAEPDPPKPRGRR